MQLADAYARIDGGECWLDGVHIAPYAFAHGFGAHDPDRPAQAAAAPRGDRQAGRPGRPGAPHARAAGLYFKEGRAKVELALAKGRHKGDKRQAIAERDADREIAEALGRQRKGMR